MIDQNIYRMLVDVDDPQMGPSISKGTLVTVYEWVVGYASVSPTNKSESERTFVLETDLEPII